MPPANRKPWSSSYSNNVIEPDLPALFLGGSTYTSALKRAHADVLTFTGCGGIGGLRELVRAGVVRTIPCHLSS